MISVNKEKILYNTLYIVVSSLIARFLFFIAAIIIARKFGPFIYGEFHTALNLISIVSIFTMLGFDTVLIREGAKNLKDLVKLQQSFFPIRLFLSIAFVFVVIILLFFLDYSLLTKRLIIILSLLVIIGGHLNSGISEHYLVAFRVYEKFNTIAKLQFYRALIFIGIIFIFYLSGMFTIETFALSITISSFIFLWLLLYYSKTILNFPIIFKVDYNYVSKFLPSILVFGLIAVLITFSSSIDIQIINHFCDSNEVGIYAASLNIYNIGVMVISALHLALFPVSSRNYNNKHFLIKLFKFYFVTFCLVFLFIFFSVQYIEDIISFIFGEKYLASIIPMKIIIWIIPLRLLMSWGNQIIEVNDLYFLKLITVLVFFVLSITLNLILVPDFGSYGAAISMLISNIVYFIITLIIAFYYINTKIF